jgi:hypothetical protein
LLVKTGWDNAVAIGSDTEPITCAEEGILGSLSSTHALPWLCRQERLCSIVAADLKGERSWAHERPVAVRLVESAMPKPEAAEAHDVDEEIEKSSVVSLSISIMNSHLCCHYDAPSLMWTSCFSPDEVAHLIGQSFCRCEPHLALQPAGRQSFLSATKASPSSSPASRNVHLRLANRSAYPIDPGSPTALY